MVSSHMQRHMQRAWSSATFATRWSARQYDGVSNRITCLILARRLSRGSRSFVLAGHRNIAKNECCLEASDDCLSRFGHNAGWTGSTRKYA